ncbi:MAG: neuraminidase-like domain-containing protein [Cyclobacteriaceae bacterium]
MASTQYVIEGNPSAPPKEVEIQIDPTAANLSGDTPYQVSGEVKDYRGLPLDQYTVKAFHVRTSGEDLLGTATTNAEGKYVIGYIKDDITDGSVYPNIRMQVELSSVVQPLWSNVIVSNSPIIAVRNLFVVQIGQEFSGPTLFSLVGDFYVAGNFTNIADFQNLTDSGIAILASSGDFPANILSSYRDAKINNAISDPLYNSIALEAYFGFYVNGLARSVVTLLNYSDERLRQALEYGIDNNYLSEDLDIDAVLLAIENLRASNLLYDEITGDSYIKQILVDVVGIDGESSEIQAFADYYYLHNNEEDFWDQSGLVNVFDGADQAAKEARRDNVKRAFQIGVIAQQYVPMIQVLFDNTTDVEDLTLKTEANWETYITTAGVPNVDSPTPIDTDLYKSALLTAVEQAFPTKVLLHRMEKTIDSNDPVNTYYTNAEVFLTNNPDFDISKGSPRDYFDTNSITDETLIEELLELKRLWHLCRGYNKWKGIDTLRNLGPAGFTSATQIAEVGERKFVKAYGASFDNLFPDQFPGVTGAEEALRVYKTAVKRVAAASQLQVTYSPSVNNISTGVYRDSSIEDADKENNPSLEVIFGSQDYCTCKHCRSSFSPSAYLVDLINFLKLIPDSSNAPDTAWDVLKQRRPEFVNIELSCDNTNVTLPYIDIVNEVLENAVADTPDFDRQTTLSQEYLRIAPEHLNENAYAKLFDGSTSAVYPWKLPFHLWNEEASSYLGLVNVKRNAIIAALVGSDGSLSASEALVSLGVSDQLKTVLEDNSAFQKYYGGSGSGITSSQPIEIEDLLAGAGLEYNDLVNLLESKFVNADNEVIEFNPADSCSVEDANLSFDGDNSQFLRNLHRFERLRRILNWKVSELDQVLTVVEAINSDLKITELAGIQSLSEKFKIPVSDIATWYGPLSEVSYEGKPSQFDAIFLNPVINKDSAVRASFTAGDVTLVASGQLDALNAPIVLAVTRLKPEDLLLLTADLSSATNATKDDLAYLYRVASFTRALKISVQDFITIKTLFGDSFSSPLSPASGPPAVPNDTLIFLKNFEDLRNSNFKLEDLKFLFLHEDLKKFKLDDASATGLFTTIRNAFQTRLGEKNIGLTKTEEDLLNLFLIFFNEDVASASLDLVRDVSDEGEANTFIDTYWTELSSDLAGIKTNLTSASKLTDLQARINATITNFFDALVTELNLETLLIQTLTDAYDYSQEWWIKVFKEKLDAVDYLISEDFVISTGDVTAIPDYDTHISQNLVKAIKCLLALSRLNSETRHLDFVLDPVGQNNGWYDLTSFTINVPATSITGFDTFLNLTRAYGLERKYFVKGEFSIIDQVINGLDENALSNGTGWNSVDIEYAANPGAGALVTVNTTEAWLVKLEQIFQVVDATGLSLEQAKTLFGSGVDVSASGSKTIQSAVKSKFSESSWLKVAVEIRDGLRAKQRDALSDYLIGTQADFDDLTSLYAYYLMDIEMAPCMLTSRIKLAISSVQLWIQRIQMGLEPDLEIGDEELDEWKWRKNYRVWEAARKVFTYPENWIEPELRDDKSPFFEEMEDELLQSEVTLESAENAYLNYLTKLDDVSALEISGIYWEEDRDILHVFARTKNVPHIYYYRTQEDGFRWTAWQTLDLDIEGDHLIPVVFNRRPMIFWPVFTEKPKVVDEETLQIKQYTGTIGTEPSKKPQTVVEIKMAYSEWKNNKWQPKKISTQNLYSALGFNLSGYFFKISIDGDGLNLDTYHQPEKGNKYNHLGSFNLNNCTSDLEARDDKKTADPTQFSVDRSNRSFMKIVAAKDATELSITENLEYTIDPESPELDIVTDVVTDSKVVLGKTPGRFKITYPVTGVDLLSNVPFFFEDKDRVFYVDPEDETYTKDILTTLTGSQINIRQYKRRRMPGLNDDI